MQHIQQALNKLHKHIGSNLVTIVAVSKKQSAAAIAAAFAAGVNHFAENNINDAIDKQSTLKNPDIEWHYIGNMQTRKSPLLAKHFTWVDSICTVKQAKKLNSECVKLDKKINILLQVNISHNHAQSGCQLEQLPELISAIGQLPHLKLRGLMCIASKNGAEQDFISMNKAFQLYKSAPAFDTLSMGMSNDYMLALRHGATQIRLGTLIFGENS